MTKLGKLRMATTGQKTGGVGASSIYVVEIQSKINSHLSKDGILMTMNFDDMEMVVGMERWRRKR